MAPEQRRSLAASYVTGQDNPWFAKAFINRIWYVLMGEAFYEPIDDMGPERTARAPEVLDPLADQWQRGGYDIRWLYRTLMNTQAYQRRARSTANAAGKTPFASGCPSRMRADQVFEALAQALALPLDAEGQPHRTDQERAPQGSGQERPAQPGRSQAALALNNSQAKAKPKAAASKKAMQAAGLPVPAGKKAAALVRRGGHARGVRATLRHRPFGPQRRRPGHDPPGPLPDEQPDGQQPDHRAAGQRPGRDPRRHPR